MQITRTRGGAARGGDAAISTGPESYGLLREVFKNPWDIDARHEVKKFAFGSEFPGAVNPLNGVRRTEEKSGVYKYFMKVVPTRYSSSRLLLGLIPWTYRLKTNQYSVTEHYAETHHWGEVPQVHFIYDLSAITVNIACRPRAWCTFSPRRWRRWEGVRADAHGGSIRRRRPRVTSRSQSHAE